MSFWSRITNFGRVKPAPGMATQAQPFARWMSQLDVPEGLVLTQDQQIACSVVYGCIRQISRDLARSPWRVYSKANGRRTELPDDPVSYLLNVRPNPDVPAAAFREALIVQAIVHGNGYAEIIRDQAGRVRELRVIPSERVQYDVARGGEVLSSYPPREAEPLENYYRVAAPMVGGNPVLLGADQVFHLRGLSTVDGSIGDSVLARAVKAIAAAYAMERFQLSYFSNNAQLGGVLKYASAVKPEQQDAILAEWNKKYAGSGNAFKLLITNADFQQITSNAEQAQLIQARAFMVEEIVRYFGVPPYKLGVAVATAGYGKNLNEMGISYVRDALRPWATTFQQEADYKLFPQRAPYRTSELDLGEFTQGDELTSAKAAEIWINTGVKSVNEVRASMGMDHLDDPEADDHRFPSEAPAAPADGTEGQDQGETPSTTSDGSEGNVGDGGDQQP